MRRQIAPMFTRGGAFHQDIQTPRRLLKTEAIAEVFTNFEVFGYPDETLFRVYDIASQTNQYFKRKLSLLGFISLVCWYISGSSSLDPVVSNLIKREITKQTSDIQQHLESLKTREDHQKRLLSEIENLKLTLQQQLTEREEKNRISTTTDQSTPNLPFIYGITPTYARSTQKADLTRLCQTLLHIPHFHWILIEDSNTKTSLVEKFLSKCGVKYTHLVVKTMPILVRKKNEPRWLKARGAEQRNAGLKWLRENIGRKDGNGVVYFMDDDNTYDLEIFEQMRHTKKVSIWPVGIVGGLKWEGPICRNGKVVKFRAAWDLTRLFPIDMAGFAINLQLLLDNPSANIDVNERRGHLESSLLKQLVQQEELEPLADDCSKILVWHTQTAEPNIKKEIRLQKAGKQYPQPEV